MLQRIQTVFLLTVSVSMTIFLFFPIWIGSNADGSTLHQIFALFLFKSEENGAREVVEYLPFAISGILAGLGVIISLVEMFAYKHRLTQIKLGALNALILAGSLVAALWFTNQAIQNWGNEINGQHGIGVFFPVAALISNMLANRFIRKDEKLVRSMDRIR